MKPTILFVYNADSGKINAYLDTLHKVFSPKTYSCSLCAITYGAFSMQPAWAEYIKTIPHKVTFLHKDEWLEAYKRSDELPAVFVQKGTQIEPLIDAKTMNRLDLDGLKALMTERLSSL